MLLPHVSILEKDGETVPWLFRDSVLFRSRRNAVEAKQLAAKHMIIPEEIGDQVIPQQQVAEVVHGAQKYSQIGGDAAEKLLRSAVDTQLLFLNGYFLGLHPIFKKKDYFSASSDFLSLSSYVLRKVWTLDRTPVWLSWI